MGLRVKILSGFLILATMLIIAGVWSIFSIKTVGHSVNAILMNNYKSMDAALSMSEAIEKINICTLNRIGSGVKSPNKEFVYADSLFQSALKTANHNITIDKERDLLVSIENLYSEFFPLCRIGTAEENVEDKFNTYFSVTLPAYSNLKSKIDELFVLNDNELYTTAIHINERSELAVMPGIVAIVSAVVFSLLFSYLINFFVITPIKEITKQIERFTLDRVPFDYHVSTNDEISRLAESVDTLCAHITVEE